MKGVDMACCGETLDKTMGQSTDNKSTRIETSADMAVVFSALSNPARIDILRHISQHSHCGCKDITKVLPLAQSTVSQHLKVLIDAGIVQVETIPPRSRYQVNDDLLKAMALTTSSFLDSCCEGKCC